MVYSPVYLWTEEETTKGVSTEVTGSYMQLSLFCVCLATAELATSGVVVIS